MVAIGWWQSVGSNWWLAIGCGSLWVAVGADTTEKHKKNTRQCGEQRTNKILPAAKAQSVNHIFRPTPSTCPITGSRTISICRETRALKPSPLLVGVAWETSHQPNEQHCTTVKCPCMPYRLGPCTNSPGAIITLFYCPRKDEETGPTNVPNPYLSTQTQIGLDQLACGNTNFPNHT